MVKYKLIYFDAKARAETIRYIFQAAGQPYEDCRIGQTKYFEIKSDLPFEQLPVLEVWDGTNKTVLSQPFVIGNLKNY